MELSQVELLKTISSFLDTHNIPHMLTGAWSVIYFGRPRASHDIDFVVELYQQDIERVITALKTLPSEYVVQDVAVSKYPTHHGVALQKALTYTRQLGDI